MVKNNMYNKPQPSLSPSSIAQNITQNVMAQSRSINESMASLNMPRPHTTPQPTTMGQSPQPDSAPSPLLQGPSNISAQ